MFDDIKGVIRSRKSKKDRQHNGQNIPDKRINNDLNESNPEVFCSVSMISIKQILQNTWLLKFKCISPLVIRKVKIVIIKLGIKF